MNSEDLPGVVFLAVVVIFFFSGLAVICPEDRIEDAAAERLDAPERPWEGVPPLAVAPVEPDSSKLVVKALQPGAVRVTTRTRHHAEARASVPGEVQQILTRRTGTRSLEVKALDGAAPKALVVRYNVVETAQGSRPEGSREVTYGEAVAEPQQGTALSVVDEGGTITVTALEDSLGAGVQEAVAQELKGLGERATLVHTHAPFVTVLPSGTLESGQVLTLEDLGVDEATQTALADGGTFSADVTYLGTRNEDRAVFWLDIRHEKGDRFEHTEGEVAVYLEDGSLAMRNLRTLVNVDSPEQVYARGVIRIREIVSR